jgi:hypothetical protein
MTCAICGCRDDDACPEVCSWAETEAPANVPICSSCVQLAGELGRKVVAIFAGRRGLARAVAPDVFRIGWELLTWLTLESDGPGAVLDRWAQSEPWSAEPAGLLEGRKVWWRARGSKPPKTPARRRGVVK